MLLNSSFSILTFSIWGLLLSSLSTNLNGTEVKDIGLKSAWEEASRLLVNDANRSFNKIKNAEGEEKRVVLYGRAITLINVQPKTSTNIDKAKALFNEVIAGSETDDLSVASLFALARIAQIYQLRPDDEEAILLYTDLIKRHPNHTLAQKAYAKRAVLRAYSLKKEPDLENRFQLIVKEAPLVIEPTARRDYMSLLANLAINLEKPPGLILDFLIQVEATGMLSERGLGDLYVRLGEFARAAGKKDIAIHYYNVFLNTSIRDMRRLIVRERLEELLKPTEKVKSAGASSVRGSTQNGGKS
jgi:tetratricopeptide (TPR) repeat protein